MIKDTKLPTRSVVKSNQVSHSALLDENQYDGGLGPSSILVVLPRPRPVDNAVAIVKRLFDQLKSS